MNTVYLTKILILVVSSLLPISVYSQAQAGTIPANSQELTLFEAVEVTTSRTANQGQPNRATRATISEPEFTLVGTSRIGSSYSAMIRHKSGEIVLVKVVPESNTGISGYEGYSIVNLSAGSVSIRQPGNTPCVEFIDRGVHCNAAGNIVELELANGEPVISANPAIVGRSGEEGEADSQSDEPEANPANPFEALREAQSARSIGGQDGNSTSGRFTPRRISPEDVPEGMRVIATPFGDRLVEQ